MSQSVSNTANVITCEKPISTMEKCGTAMSRNGTCPNNDNHVITSGRPVEATRGAMPKDATARAARTWQGLADKKLAEAVSYYRTAAGYFDSAGNVDAAKSLRALAKELAQTGLIED